MAYGNHTPKPKFGSAVLWAGCSRCNARVKYSTLRRERLTGLLVCSATSGRAVRPCWDPWPDFFDFQSFPDKSIEPPPEPLPLRYNLDAIWGNGPVAGRTSDFANAPTPAPDDSTRLQALLAQVPYYANLGKSAAFMGPNPSVAQTIHDVSTIYPLNYDGTFLPSNSIRTVFVPGSIPEPTIELTIEPGSGWTLISADTPAPQPFPDAPWSPPWSVMEGV